MALLLLLCAGISIYGSWVPFHFVNKSLSQALVDFSQIQLFMVASRSDWAANFLLFLPVGFLGTGVCRVDRDGPGGFWLLSVFLVTAISCAASTLLEFSQEWFPDRVPSFNDIHAQTIGSFWGGMVWTVCGQQVVGWARRWTAALGANQRLDNVLVLAVAIHVLSLALPLDLTIHPSDLWHKYQAGRIRLWPFQNLVPETAEAWFELAFLMGGSALAGWLMMRLLRHKGRSRVLLRLILGGLAFCSLLEVMQLLVYSRMSKVDDVILGSLGFVGGGLLFPCGGSDDEVPTQMRFRYTKSLLLTTYAAWLLLFYWWPLDFTFNPGSLLQRGQQMFQVPFVVLYEGSFANAAAEVLRKTCLFAMLAILIAATFDEHRLRGLSRWSLLLASFGGSLLLGILIELGQVALPSRTADLTDIILYGGGAVCGAFLAAYLQGKTHDPMTVQRPMAPGD